MTYIQQKQKKVIESQTNFYTPSGIHIYFKDPVENIDVTSVLSTVEEKLPSHILSEIEMIIFGWFEEFNERNLKAFYDSGTLYVSNIQVDEEELLETLLHEIAHAVEKIYGFEIYGDEKIKNEFISKRRFLHDILWNQGFKMPITFFIDTEYNQEFDEALYQKIGYDKLDNYARGIFINSYAATSLREYFATAFADFLVNSDHQFLKKISPSVYEKINSILYDEKLDF